MISRQFRRFGGSHQSANGYSISVVRVVWIDAVNATTHTTPSASVGGVFFYFNLTICPDEPQFLQQVFMPGLWTAPEQFAWLTQPVLPHFWHRWSIALHT